MTLEPGTTLGSYEILSPLGAGGMGEVYKARDTKLGREVAIKTLPEGLSADPDRMARFEREARALAALNHPNVATLYGFETEERIPFLVMELVPGETMAERISRGPIPVDEALQLFLQIAEGLEAAHAQGVIHRDLKPANVKIIGGTGAAAGSDPDAGHPYSGRASAGHPDAGRIKILDFGLAKAMVARDVASGGGDLSQSPTLTLAATQRGEILGTAAYMSPEQAKGLAIDQRTDVWAFGACLLEAISGKRAFKGKDASELMASVLMVEPDWDSIPAAAPDSLRRLLHRCLEKDARQRLHHIADVRIAVAAAMDEPAPAAATPDRDTSMRRKWLLAGAAVGLIVGAMLAIFALPDGTTPTDARGIARSPRQATISLPEGVTLALAEEYAASSAVAVAPDGSKLVYLGRRGPTAQLYLRYLDSLESAPIPDTEGAYAPFFSPDSEWVAFFDSGELKKVSLRGGEPVVVTRAHGGSSGTWSDNGWIYFTHHEEQLARVREEGGESVDFLEGGSFRPHALPDGRGILVSVDPIDSPSIRKDALEVAYLSNDGELRTLIEGGYAGRFVASGHLVFYRGRNLFAAPLELESMELTGPAVSVLDGVLTDSIWAAAQYDVALDGTLIFAAGGDLARTVPTWIDRQGNESPIPIDAQVYNTFELSPDRRRLAIHVTGSEDQIHVWDDERGTLDRITLEKANLFPIWTTDGEKVLFCSNREGAGRVYSKALEGGAAEALLTEAQSLETGGRSVCAERFSPDGSVLLLGIWGHPTEQANIWVMPMDGGAEPRPLLATPANELLPVFSPDGKWIAFLSDKTGPYEVFVRPFPNVDEGEWQVSSGHGDDPRWSPQGDEIFYRSGNRLMTVEVETEPAFRPGTPELIWEIPFHNSAGLSFEVSADAQRFLVNRPIDAETRDPPIRVIFNWFEELERLVPTN